MPIVVQIDAYDPAIAGAITLRMASDDDVAVCHLDGQAWWPVLDKLPTLAMDFFGGEFGQVTTAAASMSLAVEPWPDFGRYAFADARIRIWHGDYNAAWAGYTLRFDGRVTSQPVIEDGRAQIGFAVDDQWLDTPLLTTYAGTGGIEGAAAMKGTPKPLAIGAPMGVAGVMLDPNKSIIQLSAYGAIESVDVPLEKLARQFGSPLANYGSYAALDAATVPAGQWATANAGGLVRMGAPPYGKLCFLMKGDKGGVDGWVRRPGAIIKRLAALAGGAAKVSEASVDALDAARPYDLSVYYDSQINARAAIQEIAASVNAVAGVSLTGQMIVVPIQINAATLTLRADGSSLPIVGAVRALGMSAPWWRLSIGAQPFFDVHGQGDYVALPSVARFPTAPPAVMLNGGSYFDASNKQFIYDDPVVRIGDVPVKIGDALVTTSGYADVQDLAIPQALADAAAADAAAAEAQAAANAANAAIPQALADAAAADAAAAEAQAAANAANAAIAQIDDDAVIDISEKVKTLIPGAAAFEALYTAVVANANAASVSITTLNTRRTAWLAALAAISPAWNNIAAASPVVRGSLDTARSQYDSELKNVQALAIEAMSAAKSPDLTGNFQWDISADTTGTVITSPLPDYRRYKGMEGANDVSPTTNFVLSSVSGSLALSVNNTPSSADRGVVELGTGTTGGGTAILTATLPGGGVVSRTITFPKTNAPAPTGGGAGATFAQDTSFNTITSGSHVAISDELICRSNASGQIKISVDLQYYASDGTVSRTPAFKASYATSAGGSLTDLFTEESGSFVLGGLAGEPEFYTRAQETFNMPAANTDYYFKLQGRRISGSGNIAFMGYSLTVRQ